MSSIVAGAARKDVRDVLARLHKMGLDLRRDGRSPHVKVLDPATGAFLFIVTSTPSDSNFVWEIRRHLRRIGLDWDSGGVSRSRHTRAKVRGAIDLEALKRAQAAAESAGERIPQLSDLDDRPELLARIGYGDKEYTPAATQERIETMGMPKSEAPRFRATVQRLGKFLEEHDAALAERANRAREARGEKRVGGRGGKTEFVRIAMEEVAPARGLRSWKSSAAGQQTLLNVLGKDAGGATVWVINLLEATMDHIEGLRWDTDVRQLQLATTEDAKQKEADDIMKDVEAALPKPEPAPAELEWKELQVAQQVAPSTDGRIRELYTEALLDILKQEGSSTSEQVLLRLDKLAGIA